MIIKHFQAGILGANNYLLIDEVKKIAILIDCSAKTAIVDEELKKYGATLEYILLTHGHFDHVLGINKTREAYPNVKVLAHAQEKDLIENINAFMQKYGMGTAEVPVITDYIQEGTLLNNIKVLHTPGHTKGSVCYLIDDNLFSGDTIFLETIGRTDLDGGSFSEIKNSIETKIFTLDDNVKIYSGHGDFTSVKHEKENNTCL